MLTPVKFALVTLIGLIEIEFASVPIAFVTTRFEITLLLPLNIPIKGLFTVPIGGRTTPLISRFVTLSSILK